MRQLTGSLPGTVPDPLYPDSDDVTVGETDFHLNALIWLREALQTFFARAADVYVGSDLFWYWEKGNPRACTAPDAMVVKGVGKHQRRSLRSWEEGGTRPCTIVEIASERTWRADVEEKPILYAELGVHEYFIFDPEGVFVSPVLQGFRLVRRRYVRLRAAADGSLVSKELGLRLTPEGPMLRLRGVRTGRRVLTRTEQAKRASRRAEHQHRIAEQQRQVAEQQRQVAEQQRLLAEQQRQVAEQQRQVAEQQRLLKEQAERRGRELEEQLARLKAQQASSKQGPGNGKRS